mmetsp:Transcript_79566/g.257741  ORF Transcript_79566/g.257741 Transcript_79566/m.257741 type:complete len:445 (+) Transcript_79566:139-1473(+)
MGCTLASAVTPLEPQRGRRIDVATDLKVALAERAQDDGDVALPGGLSDKPPLDGCRVQRRCSVRHARERYCLEGQLGLGGCAVVVKAVSKETGEAVAVKVMTTEMVKANDLHLEVDILASMDHPNIVRLIECMEDQERTYVVMELCEGGELLGRVQWTDGLQDVQVACAMRQVLSAVQHMHNRLICHRDIKAENLMLVSRGPIERNIVKAVDFGFACSFQPGVPMTKKAGTISYLAPEVLLQKYYASCDLWSCGCLMYLLCIGKLPFRDSSDDKICKRIKKGSYSVPRRVSSDAKELITGLLSPKLKDRLSAQQALSHPWIRLLAPVPAPRGALLGKIREKGSRSLQAWDLRAAAACGGGGGGREDDKAPRRCRRSETLPAPCPAPQPPPPPPPPSPLGTSPLSSTLCRALVRRHTEPAPPYAPPRATPSVTPPGSPSAAHLGS